MRDDDSETIEELLLRWDKRRDSGFEISATELCKDHPHLLPILEEKIQKLKGLDLFEIEESPVQLEDEGLDHGLDARIPRRIGDYDVVNEVDRGGMGIVYRCKHKSHLRHVALKVLRPDFSLDSKQAARLKREAEILGTLDHPSIARILDCGITPAKGNVRKHSFVALEFVEGKSLREYAKGKTTRDIVELVIQITDAISYAHQRGVVHRDIKPTNVVVTDDGVPKVLDFGVAKFVARDSNTELTSHDSKTLLGTLPYMSPEQIDSPNLPDVRSDVYSVSVLAYELLTESSPFAGKDDSPAKILKAIEKGNPKSLAAYRPELAGALDEIVLKGLSRAPEDRYQSAAQLVEDLRRYFAGEPIVGAKVPALTRLRRWAKRNRTLALVSIGSVCLVLVSSLFAFYAAVQANRDAAEATAATTIANDRATELARANYNLNLSIAADNLPCDPLAVVQLLDDPKKCPEQIRDFVWRLLRQRSGSAIRLDHEFETPASSVCFCPQPNSRLLFVGFKTGRVVGVLVDKWEVVFDQTPFEESIEHIACNSDGSIVMVATTRGVSSVLRVDAEEQIARSVDPVSPVAMLTFSEADQGFYLLRNDGTLLFGGTPAFDLEVKHQYEVTNLHRAAFSDSARTVFVASGKKLAFLDLDEGTVQIVQDRPRRPVDCISFLRTGEAIEVSNLEATVRDPKTGEFLRHDAHFPRPIAFKLMDRSKNGIEAIFGRRLKVRWENQYGNRFRDLVASAPSWRPKDLAVSSSGDFLAVARSNAPFVVLDLDPTTPSYTHDVRAMRFAAIDEQGAQLLLADPGVIRIKSESSADSKSLEIELAKPPRIAIDEQRQHVAVAAKASVHIVDLESMKIATTLKCPQAPADICFSNDDQTLVCNGKNGELLIWDLESKECESVSIHDNLIRRIANVPHSHDVIAADRSGPLCRINLLTKEVLWKTDYSGGVRDLLVSPDGQDVLTCERDGEILRWNATDGNLIARIIDSNSPFNAISMSPDGKTLASIDASGFIDFWDPKTGLHRLRLESHEAEGMDIEFTSDGLGIVSSALDGKVHTWRLTPSKHVVGGF